MLHDQSLPFFLWEEACSTVVYVLNKSPHRALGSKTPEETFTGKVPEIGHFRIFGFLTFSHVPFEKRTKLEVVGERGILLVMTRLRRLFVYTFLHKGKLWLEGAQG